MKKGFFIVVIMLFLTSCSYFSPSGNGKKITPPLNIESPVYGQWKITKHINTNTKKLEHDMFTDMVGINIYTIKDHFIIDKYYWNKVSYKTKLLTAKDYYSSIGITTPNQVSDPLKEVQVFSILYNSKPICDITILNKNTATFSISGNLYEVKKVSSNTNIDMRLLTPASKSSFVRESVSTSKTGVLLGLKTPVKDSNGNKKILYRTLWISKSNNNLNPIFEISTIMFPRKNGFWTLSESLITRNGVNENIFIPHDLSQPDKSIVNLDSLVTEQNLHGYKNGTIQKEITYVCNDYISAEITGNAMRNGVNEPINKLHIYPVSSLPYENSISIEDIFKGTAVNFIRKEFFSALESINGNTTFLNTDEQNQNIGITRRDSHWLFTGRIGYIDNSTNKFNKYDYNLSIIPPSNMVFYDNLFSPFTKIKESIPYAMDAFSSYNNTMAIIVSDSYLYVYDIINNPLTSLELNDKYLAKIKLNKEESVIMSEWASGEYVDSWNNVVKSFESSRVIKK